MTPEMLAVQAKERCESHGALLKGREREVACVGCIADTLRDALECPHGGPTCTGTLAKDDAACEGCYSLAKSQLDAAMEENARLREALREAHELAARWDGDILEWSDHWEDCRAADEDAFDVRIHAQDCPSHPGESVPLVPPRRWPDKPEEQDPSCCEPDFDRDEDQMLAVCDCSKGAFYKIEALTRAALGPVPASIPHTHDDSEAW